MDFDLAGDSRSSRESTLAERGNDIAPAGSGDGMTLSEARERLARVEAERDFLVAHLENLEGTCREYLEERRALAEQFGQRKAIVELMDALDRSAAGRLILRCARALAGLLERAGSARSRRV
jgi:hypothetical protein